MSVLTLLKETTTQLFNSSTLSLFSIYVSRLIILWTIEIYGSRLTILWTIYGSINLYGPEYDQPLCVWEGNPGCAEFESSDRFEHAHQYLKLEGVLAKYFGWRQ